MIKTNEIRHGNYFHVTGIGSALRRGIKCAAMNKDFSDFPTIEDQILRDISGAVSEAEYKLLHSVLVEYIGSEPQLSDWAKCVMKYRREKPDQYIFEYDGNELGSVKRTMRTSYLPNDFVMDVSSIGFDVEFRPTPQP